MQKKTLLYATAVVAVMVVLVVVLGRQQAPLTDSDAQGPMLKGLKGQVANIDRITLRNVNDSVTIKRLGEGWSVVERTGYPADFSRLETLLSGLLEAQLVEAKTARPEHHHRLGLAGIEHDDSETVQLHLFSATDAEPLHGLQIGKSAPGQDAQYVRIGEELQTWLVDQSFDASADPSDWLDKDLIDLSFDRIARYNRHSAEGGDYAASKATPTAATFVAVELPEARSLSYESALNGPVRALSNARLEDVRRLDEATAPEQFVETIYQGFDGLQLRVRAWQDSEEQSWISLSATLGTPVEVGDPSVEQGEDSKSAGSAPELTDPVASAPEAETEAETEAEAETDAAQALKSEVDQLNTRLDGWAFKVSNYSYGELSKGLEEYLADLPDESDEAQLPQQEIEAAPAPTE